MPCRAVPCHAEPRPDLSFQPLTRERSNSGELAARLCVFVPLLIAEQIGSDVREIRVALANGSTDLVFHLGHSERRLLMRLHDPVTNTTHVLQRHVLLLQQGFAEPIHRIQVLPTSSHVLFVRTVISRNGPERDLQPLTRDYVPELELL